jgi:hypothetical protein
VNIFCNKDPDKLSLWHFCFHCIFVWTILYHIRSSGLNKLGACGRFYATLFTVQNTQLGYTSAISIWLLNHIYIYQVVIRWKLLKTTNHRSAVIACFYWLIAQNISRIINTLYIFSGCGTYAQSTITCIYLYTCHHYVDAGLSGLC